MRSVQIYRWQVPMDAGVVLRERRLKTRDGMFVHLRQNDRQGWGEIAPLPGFSHESLEEAEAALRAWSIAWRDGGEPLLPGLASVDFGISCALAELDGALPDAADYRAAPLCTGDPDELFALLAAMPDKAEPIRQLAYHLYTLCERKKWADDARAYNELITAWHAIVASSLEAGHRDTQFTMDV